MCDVLDRVENRGKALGAEAKAKETAINMYKRGMKPSDIARTIGLTERRVRQIIKEEREKE